MSDTSRTLIHSDPETGTPETAGAAIGADIRKWRDVIKAAGIREAN